MNQQPASGSAFDNLGLDPVLIAALDQLNLEAPTEIQTRMIPLALQDRDCLAIARPGAGKTNAYILPVVQKCAAGGGLQALVIQPTRALATQMEKNFGRFTELRGLRAAVMAGGGGRGRRDEPDPLRDAPEILIATPRAADNLLRRDDIDWDTVKMVVVDEADAIQDGDDLQHVRHVLDALEHDYQTILLTGQRTPEIDSLVGTFMSEPELIEVTSDFRAGSTEHQCMVVEDSERLAALVAYCRRAAPKLALVFTNSGRAARDLCARLADQRIESRWINQAQSRPPRGRHGGRGPRSRTDLVISDDPAPRRLSTIPAGCLLHYEMPADADTYIQRVRQCDRLRRAGVSVALVTAGEASLIAAIEARLGKPFTRLEKPELPTERAPRPRVEGDRPVRSDPPRSAPLSPAPLSPAPFSPAPRATKPPGPKPHRLSEPIRRDPELDARGVKPMPRTLGSRFRPKRAR